LKKYILFLIFIDINILIVYDATLTWEEVGAGKHSMCIR